MATLAEHIAARNDVDLLARFIAAAEVAGIANPQQWAEANRGALVASTVGSDGQTISDVYAYALANTPPPPGKNPAAVTDSQITTAVAAVESKETQE